MAGARVISYKEYKKLAKELEFTIIRKLRELEITYEDFDINEHIAKARRHLQDFLLELYYASSD